ncbi:MAG: TlpA family protein disulfide reductase [Myxococcales bacterium]|nr:TlpA family protein disulfide reductase [Myxococcales bacterium]
MDGESVRLAPEEGESVVVHFWATWCRSCVKELGVLDAEAQRCAEDPVRVLAVNVGDEADEIRAFLADRPISIPILRDAKGKIWRDVAGLGLPANLFWTGDEQRVEVGPLSLADWRRELEGLGCAPPS